MTSVFGLVGVDGFGLLWWFSGGCCGGFLVVVGYRLSGFMAVWFWWCWFCVPLVLWISGGSALWRCGSPLRFGCVLIAGAAVAVLGLVV